MAVLATRSSPLSAASSSSTIVVIIVLGTICATYLVAVLLYYIVCLTQAILAKRRWLMTINANSDNHIEVETLARAISEKSLDLSPEPDIYSIPARRTKLFRHIFTARRCSAFSVRRLLCFTPSPLRHVLFTREDFLEDPAPQSPILSVLVLQEIAGENVEVLARYVSRGSVTYTLGKPMKGVCGTHRGGKENQPIPSVLLEEPISFLES
ncbi:hypothetical protein CPB85DRAFT_1306017 [Mucidula mucida]|nr:hypothetical protein CPB85DRAFT_1306017 [Mucidula mucida]